MRKIHSHLLVRSQCLPFLVFLIKLIGWTVIRIHIDCSDKGLSEKKMLENRPEDALDSLVETVEMVKTVETVESVKMVETACTALTAGTAQSYCSFCSSLSYHLLMNPEISHTFTL